MAVDTQEKVRLQFGTSAEITGQNPQEGGVFSVDSTDVVRVTRKNLTQLIIGGSGALSGKYWVNVAGQQPATTYTTIASAMAAAVADGHSDTNPAVIWVLPGTYTENITMLAGISIQGMVSGTNDAAVHIVGTVDVGLPANEGDIILSNVVIDGRLTGTGTKAAAVQLDNVRVVQTDIATSPVVFSSTQLVVTANRFHVICLPACAVPAFSVTASVTFSGTEGQIITDSDRVALSIVNAAGASIVSFTEAVVQGSIAITDKVDVRLRACRLVSASTLCTFTTDGTLHLIRCEVTVGDSTLIATGPGLVIDVDSFYVNPVTGVGGATTLTSTVRYTHRQHTEFEFTGAGPYTITTLFDTFLVNTAEGAPANKTLNLPALNTIPRGTRLRIQKQVAILNTVIVTPSGANTIGGIAGNLTLAAGTLTGVTLQAGATDWRIAAN